MIAGEIADQKVGVGGQLDVKVGFFVDCDATALQLHRQEMAAAALVAGQEVEVIARSPALTTA